MLQRGPKKGWLRSAEQNPARPHAQAQAAGANVTLLRQCMGSTTRPDNPRLQAMNDEAASQGQRGDIIEGLLPTASVQGVQYRGNLAATPVLQFVCSGFCGSSAPAVCPRGLAARPCPTGCAPPLVFFSSRNLRSVLSGI